MSARARRFWGQWLLPVLALLLAGPSVARAQCEPSATRLCLDDGRFSVDVTWTDFGGNQGVGEAKRLTAETGWFWFFDEDNVELLVKVLDGRPINGHFWVFYASLSNVEYTLHVKDLETGKSREYVNSLGNFASVGDTRAFPAPDDDGEGLAASRISPATESGPLILGAGRFRVEVEWRDFQGGEGAGHPVPLTDDTGAFWFFAPANLELVVKVLDARPINDHFWVFFGALSNVSYSLTVTDTETGVRRVFDNPAGRFASRGDTRAIRGSPLPIIGFSPRLFLSVDQPWVTPDNVRDFFEEVDSLGAGVFAVHPQWWDLLETDGALLPGFEEQLEDLPRLPERIVGTVQFTDPATGLPRIEPGSGWERTWESWNANGGWELFTEATLRLAERHQPPFLSIGVEINPFARKFPGEYAHFAQDIYPEIVRRVAGVSPDTIVFPGFQYERMMGDLVGSVGPDGEPGCDGCVPPSETNSLSGRTHPPIADVLNAFPPEALTHVGFTTYPYHNRDFATPADIPEDYYTRLHDRLDADHQGVHVVFTEAGWPGVAELSPGQACLVCTTQRPESTATCFPEVVPDAVCPAVQIEAIGEALADWLGGPGEQVGFAERFAELTGPLSPALVSWTLLHDADERDPVGLQGLFTNIGLKRHRGEPRPVYHRWLELFDLDPPADAARSVSREAGE